MIKTDSNSGKSIKEIKAQEARQQEEALKEKCQALADKTYGADQVVKWSNENKGLWFLAIEDQEGGIEAMAVMKPITRQILSYASTKITDDGLYAFLEVCMRDCWVAGDEKIMDEDEYFIPAAMQFNKILEGKKAALVKR